MMHTQPSKAQRPRNAHAAGFGAHRSARRECAANRRNARASTDFRTAAGKARWRGTCIVRVRRPPTTRQNEAKESTIGSIAWFYHTSACAKLGEGKLPCAARTTKASRLDNCNMARAGSSEVVAAAMRPVSSRARGGTPEQTISAKQFLAKTTMESVNGKQPSLGDGDSRATSQERGTPWTGFARRSEQRGTLAAPPASPSRLTPSCRTAAPRRRPGSRSSRRRSARWWRARGQRGAAPMGTDGRRHDLAGADLRGVLGSSCRAQGTSEMALLTHTGCSVHRRTARERDTNLLAMRTYSIAAST